MAWVTLRGLARTMVVRLGGIAAFTLALGIGLSWLVDVAISEPEWTETAAIGQRAVDRSGLPELLAGQSARSPKRWAEESARLVRELPGVVHIKVWDPQGNVVWAVPSGAIGQHSDAQELRDALSGRVTVRFNAVAPPNAAPDSISAPNAADLYVPVYGPGGARVVGVVELSQAPLRMDAAQERWSQLTWTITLSTGGVLCLILLPTAWRSHRRTRGEASSTAQRSVQRTQELQRTTEQLREALKAVKHRAEETDRMLEVTEAIGSALEQKELFEVIAHGAARACRVDRGSIFLRDKSGQLMVPVSSQLADRAAAAKGGNGAESLRALALEEMPSFLLEAVRRQEPVVISDPGSDPRVPQGWVGLFQAKSALVVPLIHQGRTAGVLILDHLKTLHVFTDEEIRLATTLAAQAAVALEKARLYDEIQQRLQQTETLLAVSQAIGSAPDLPEAIRRTTREMVRILGADNGVAWCVTRGGDRFIPLAGYHLARDLREPLSALPLAPDDPLIDLVKRLRTALHSSNSKTDPRFNQPALNLLPHTSLLVQPVQVSDELLGIFAIAWARDAHAFSLDDLRLADGIAKQAAVAIELHRSQRHIIEQERLNAVGKMASGLAHDFNNALVPISGYAEMLLEHQDILQDSAKATKYLKLIMTGVEDAASVVSRLREFYRKREEGETYRPLSLNQMVEQAVALTRPRWRDEALGSGRTILVEADMRPVPKILGSESELRELLTNLIFNAVDAMPEGGTIRIRTGLREGVASEESRGGPAVPRVFLEVSDTGTGMTEEVRRRCLEPFFSTKGERGTGLGLPMVFGIVKRHRGTLDIESTVGKGTTFIVLLPADTTQTREVQQRAAAPRGPLRVLVVDDEPIARDVLTEYLTGDGHTVETAANGREGFEKFKAGRFAVVITDRAMPEMGGDQLAAMVKESSPTTPVILLTGFGDLMNAAGEKPDGVDLVVKKPIRLATLREVLAKMTAAPGAAGLRPPVTAPGAAR
jgi:signal transduction histidine kinase/CheY-like chemotaxis protein